MKAANTLTIRQRWTCRRRLPHCWTTARCLTRRSRAMRHRNAGRKFGRNSAQRQAMLRQLAISMILHERITTTEAKAKEIRPVVEKLVTIAREDTPHHRKLIMSKIDNDLATVKLFEVIAPRFETTPGGYTRIARLGTRRGDAAPLALIEFVD